MKTRLDLSPEEVQAPDPSVLDNAKLLDLIDRIEQSGIAPPISVYRLPAPANPDTRFVLVAGHYSLEACRLLNRLVPAAIRENYEVPAMTHESTTAPKAFDLLDLRPDQVMITDRLVELREDHVLDLAEHIERSGFVQPILVARLKVPQGNADYRLIAGRHRTEACRLLGRNLPAMVVKETDLEDGEEQLLEALENSGRLVLTHSQKIRHEQIILQHYVEKLGRPLNRKERTARVAEVAQRNNWGEASARQAVHKAEVLTPEILEAVKGSPMDTVRGLQDLLAMKDDAARMKRIEKTKARAKAREEQGQGKIERPGGEQAKQTAQWILDILEQGLNHAEIMRIHKLLELTNIAALRTALNGVQEGEDNGLGAEIQG